MLSAVLCALINYAVITASETVLDLAKDFTALIIISEIDNQFASFHKNELIENALTQQDYAGLFKIETTSSVDARGKSN